MFNKQGKSSSHPTKLLYFCEIIFGVEITACFFFLFVTNLSFTKERNSSQHKYDSKMTLEVKFYIELPALDH